RKKLKRVKVITLGCSKNRVDSEHLLRQISGCGFFAEAAEEIADIKGADILLINTCGFIHDAKRESVETILEAVEEKRKGNISKIFVFGCLSQRYLQELKESIPEVDRFFGVFDRESVVSAIGGEWDHSCSHERYITTPSHYAYLKISDGCDRSCSYCSIPLIKGPYTSVPEDQLVKEAEYLVSSEVKELILIAQDTTCYGRDLKDGKSLVSLVKRLSAIDSLDWIRILYAYPAGFPSELLNEMAENPKICKYLDIPLQHISTRVLTAMRRGVDSAETRSLVERIRREVPSIALRTTMIVGHPGEGRREFRELLNFVKEAQFERLGAFTYSREDGTWGAENLKERITKAEKEERYATLMELQSSISLKYNLTRVGSIEKVLIDKIDGGVLTGRTQKEAPEVDGEVIIGGELKKEDFNKLIGNFVPVEITDADEYDLYSKIV
ncbi:MAG: 30S ribosomal protein S12 methylthiotransferase RimO, partial [Bacteroidales bacterium]|nr:30S ribosomal protein S12 methylthiotransferase RimO [Bacteroidales bacterium]